MEQSLQTLAILVGAYVTFGSVFTVAVTQTLKGALPERLTPYLPFGIALVVNLLAWLYLGEYTVQSAAVALLGVIGIGAASKGGYDFVKSMKE